MKSFWKYLLNFRKSKSNQRKQKNRFQNQKTEIRIQIILLFNNLNIHLKFYEKLEQSLSDLIISFKNISIRNILGGYLSSKGNNDESMQRKQEIINKVKKFRDQIKNGKNSRNFLEVFEESFLSLKGDSKSKCFFFSQIVIDLLQNYIQCIQQGVQEFFKDHNQLIEQEN